MGKISKNLMLFTCLAFFFACSGKKASPRTLEVFLGSLSSSSFAGGAIVRIENTSNGSYTDIELSSAPYTFSLQDGTWNIYFIGFDGPTQWQGTTNCGGAIGVNLTASTAEINITAKPALCAGAPYTELISGKTSTWDQALWGQAKWGT